MDNAGFLTANAPRPLSAELLIGAALLAALIQSPEISYPLATSVKHGNRLRFTVFKQTRAHTHACCHGCMPLETRWGQRRRAELS